MPNALDDCINNMPNTAKKQFYLMSKSGAVSDEAQPSTYFQEHATCIALVIGHFDVCRRYLLHQVDRTLNRLLCSYVVQLFGKFFH